MEQLSIPGLDRNEDAALVAPPLIGVADGATPLEETADMDAGELAHRALQELRANADRPPEAMFSAAIQAIRYDRTRSRPVASCTVGVVVADESNLRIVVLGDCLVVVRTKLGAVHVVHDDRLVSRDSHAVAHIAACLKAGKSYEEAREETLPLLRKNRLDMNREGSYWTFADDPAAANHILTKLLRQDAFDSLLLCTDGFAALVDPLQLASGPDRLLDWAQAEGLDSLAIALREAETAPDSIRTFPRLAPSDDATAILVTVVS